MDDRRNQAEAMSAYLQSPGGAEFKLLLESLINMWFLRLQDLRITSPVTVSRIHGGIQFASELYRKLYGEINYGRIAHDQELNRAEGFYNQTRARNPRFEKAAI